MTPLMGGHAPALVSHCQVVVGEGGEDGEAEDGSRSSLFVVGGAEVHS